MYNLNMKNRFSYLKSNIAYTLFNTPIRMPALSIDEFKMIREAKQRFDKLNPDTIAITSFRNYVVHRFENRKASKKALVVHGWSSKSVYMIKFIEILLDLGFEVDAVDLPAHGASKGFQVSWNDSIKTVLDVQRKLGDYDFALGHSLGGAAILASISLANYLPDLEEFFYAKKIAVVAAPCRMMTIVNHFSEHLNLDEEQKDIFEKKIKEITGIDLSVLDGRTLYEAFPTEIDFLCAHGTDDKIIPYSDSEYFSKLDRVQHLKLEGEGHIHILKNEVLLETLKSFAVF